MEPFDGYPEWGDIDPRPLLGEHCRTDYGAQLQQLTHQTRCAYCDLDLTDTYERWLLLSVDHVIPQHAIANEGHEWWERVGSIHSMVVCCSACNDFLSGFRLPVTTAVSSCFEESRALRDQLFCQRREWARRRHEYERKQFAAGP